MSATAGRLDTHVSGPSTAEETYWGWPARWTPPVRKPQFWATQLLVVGIAAVHDAIEFFGYLPWFGGAYFLPISMFFIPVVYAALYFGLSGAVATALWCTVLSVPNWIWAHDPAESVGAIAQMGIINLMAIFVGIRADHQMKARAGAEAASRARQASEARYRGLFETSGEGILALAADGRIIECNAAASRLLQAPPETLRGTTLSAALSQAQSRKPHGTEAIAITGPDGDESWIEPVTTSLADTGEMQVVLRDVTGPRRRQMGLATYAAQVVRAQEEERKRLAQELHDDTVQSLVLLWRQLDALTSRSGDDLSPSIQCPLREARDLVASIAESVRGYARGLRPPILDDLGLGPAIRRLTAELAERSPVAAEVVVQGIARRLRPDVELALYRIAQESIRNTERHAAASAVSVILRYDDDTTALTIRDNGQGFEFTPGQELADTKLGLLGMHERARVCGGEVTIRSRPGAGTTVIAKIPHGPSSQS